MTIDDPIRGRRAGKSRLAQIWREFALDSGRTVVTVTPDGAVKQWKEGGRVISEPLPQKRTTMTVILDDPEMRE